MVGLCLSAAVQGDMMQTPITVTNPSFETLNYANGSPITGAGSVITYSLSTTSPPAAWSRHTPRRRPQ